jgi:hypothetical protein
LADDAPLRIATRKMSRQTSSISVCVGTLKAAGSAPPFRIFSLVPICVDD